jgi:AcrR family transcriptional regulator
MRVSKVFRQDILDAARRAFFAHGLRAVRLDDIARDLGISKKTLYQHFDDKEALVREVVLGTAEGLFADVERQLASPGSALGQLEALFDRVQALLRQLPPGAVIDLARLYPDVLAELLERRRRFLTRYLGLIARGQKAGEIRDDFPASALSRSVLALIETMGHPSFIERSGLAMTDVVRLIRAIFLGGLSARAQEVTRCDAPLQRRSRRR